MMAAVTKPTLASRNEFVLEVLRAISTATLKKWGRSDALAALPALLVVAVLAVVAGFVLRAQTVPNESPAESSNDELVLVGVTRVVDGDTVDVKLDSGPIRVRMQGIDAPERGQLSGGDATALLQSLVGGAEVELSPSGQFSYDRMVARVYFDGHDVNAEMIKRDTRWQSGDSCMNSTTVRATAYSSTTRDPTDSGSGGYLLTKGSRRGSGDGGTRSRGSPTTATRQPRAASRRSASAVRPNLCCSMMTTRRSTAAPRPPARTWWTVPRRSAL